LDARGGGWEAGLVGWAPFGLAVPFFKKKSRKLKYTFGGSKIFRKKQIRYRWILHKKYFNIRPNLVQDIKFIKPKFNIHVYVAIVPFQGLRFSQNISFKTLQTK
jgi:hypothetical protein